jgi:hypothetical protein
VGAGSTIFSDEVMAIMAAAEFIPRSWKSAPQEAAMIIETEDEAMKRLNERRLNCAKMARVRGVLIVFASILAIAVAGCDSAGDEESATQFAKDETYDNVRAGARLILAFDEQSNTFVGTVENGKGHEGEDARGHENEGS